MKTTVLFLFLNVFIFSALAQEYILQKNISYVSSDEKDNYRQERCKLDIYYPTDKKDFATVVWFHGGGLEGGEKEIPYLLKEQGIAVVAPNYRLSPMAKNPAYTEDAAAAIAWVFENIESFGGSVNDIYIAGHSAGGYLTLMVGFDRSYLNHHSIDANRIKGLIPVSGQTNTHYNIRKERGLPSDIPIVDEYAPINLIRKDVPPTLLISGDRNLEMTARYEENAHLNAVLRGLGNKDVTLYELQGFNHGNVYHPACLLILDWVKKYSK